MNFRRTEQADVPTIAEWIAADETHRGIAPEFFAVEQVSISCYVIEDEGCPVIFVRQEACGNYTRLHVQFPPGDRKRVVKVFEEGYPLVANDAQMRGFKSIRFESRSLALIRFMFQKFGFRADLIADL